MQGCPIQMWSTSKLKWYTSPCQKNAFLKNHVWYVCPSDDLCVCFKIENFIYLFIYWTLRQNKYYVTCQQAVSMWTLLMLIPAIALIIGGGTGNPPFCSLLLDICHNWWGILLFKLSCIMLLVEKTVVSCEVCNCQLTGFRAQTVAFKFSIGIIQKEFKSCDSEIIHKKFQEACQQNTQNLKLMSGLPWISMIPVLNQK